MAEMTTQVPLSDLVEQVDGNSSRQTEPVRPLRSGLALLSIVALLCSSLEIELIEQVDGLSRYMKYREIALDVGVGVLLLFLISLTWWLFTLGLGQIAQLISSRPRYREFSVWHFGLAIPLSYFGFDIIDAIRLRWFVQWHPGRFVSLWLALFCTVLLLVCLSRIPVSSLQNLCHSRLSAIGWFHIAVGALILLVLWFEGSYFFSDYAHPGKAVANRNLPDIYLITFDALRADEMSLYGYNRRTTPSLDLFAQHSYVFDYFIANSNLTTPATASIETGRLPWSHHVYQLGGFLRGQNRAQNLPALLQEHGYYTAMISSNYVATPIQHHTLASYDAMEFIDPVNASGAWMHCTNIIGTNVRHTLSTSLLRGFAVLRLLADALLWSDRYPSPPEAVFDAARQLLERRDISQPRFLWTHIYAPHDPYLAPLPFRRKFLDSSKLTRMDDFIGFRNTALPARVSDAELRARYDEMVSYGDHVVGQFLNWLQTSGRLDRSIVIVAADHGESFDHGWFGHTGPYLYNGLIRVPLLIHLPGQTQGMRVSQVAQQADLLPTILDLVGGEVPSTVEGRSLKGVMQGKQLSESAVFSMNLEPDRIFRPISMGTLAIIDNEFKYITQLAANREELYRYRTDQNEDHNLIESEPEVAGALRERLLKKLTAVNVEP